METISRAELFAILDAQAQTGPSDPEVARAQDLELMERCSAERAVLVLDLSGFTRLTKTRGILHFLGVYRRAMRLACPLIESHHGRCVKLDADNVLGAFPRATDALAAARAIRAGSEIVNAELPLDDHVLVCQGVGFGRILDLRDDLYGDEVNVAFKLGEDIARAQEILVSDRAAQRLVFEGGASLSVLRSVDVGGVTLRYFAE